VKTLIPSVRAFVAKELITKYNLRQVDVAKMLGVTQAAISQYLRGARGNIINLQDDEDIRKIVNRIAEGLINGDLSKREISLLICEICYQIRKKGIYCNAGIKIQGKYAEVADLMCIDYDPLRRSGELKETIEKLLKDSDEGK